MNTKLVEKQTTPYAHLKIVHRKDNKQQKVCFNPEKIQFVENFSKHHIEGLKIIVEQLRFFIENPDNKKERNFLISTINNWESVINNFIDFKEYSDEFNKLAKFRHE